MFTLRIKSPSGLESVVHSQLLLFSSASSKLAFEGCFAAPWPGKAAHGQSPRVKSGMAAGKLGKSFGARPRGLGFSRTNIFSTLANIRLSALLQSAGSPLIYPSGLIRAVVFPTPAYRIRPRSRLATKLPTSSCYGKGHPQRLATTAGTVPKPEATASTGTLVLVAKYPIFPSKTLDGVSFPRQQARVTF